MAPRNRIARSRAITAEPRVRLASYVVRWDHGFAPNPFHGWCTVATCKPDIRKAAQVGDWIMGTGSKEFGYNGRLVFLMRVTETTTFDGYWRDPRFLIKRPVLNGSFKRIFGDNIYHRPDGGGDWLQANSRHSEADGSLNGITLDHDTAKTDRVLLSNHFNYWGDKAPELPRSLRHMALARQGYQWNFAEADVERLLDWAMSDGVRGRIGDPILWREDFVRKWRNTRSR